MKAWRDWTAVVVLALCVFVPTGQVLADEGDCEAESETVVFVDGGVVVSGRARCIGGQWKEGDGYLEISGLNTHLTTTVGIDEGDFRVGAKLSIHGLARSAAAFKMNHVNSFGFEGSHGKVYLTGPLLNDASGTPIGEPADFLKDGEPFLFEVIRQDGKLRFSIDGKVAYEQDATDGPLGPLSFTGRRATIRLVDFSATASFQSVETSHVTFDGIVLDPRVTYLPNLLMGPFVRIADGTILTVNDRSVYASCDEGNSWRVRWSFDREEKMAFSAERALVRTKSGTLICVFLNQALRKWGWDSTRHQPIPAARSDVWSIRSLDEGKSWIDAQMLYGDSYSGCIRGLTRAADGNVIASLQGFVPDLYRHATFPYVSLDECKTWSRSANTLDLEGRGHHDGAIEGTLVQLRDGRLWLLMRTSYDQLYSSFSEDCGLTWSGPEPSGIDASDGPPVIMRLADGRLVLLWNRLYPEGKTDFTRSGGDERTLRIVSRHREELSMALSPDEGTTWTRPVVLGRKKGAVAAYPYVFEPQPGYLWVTTMQGELRIGLELANFVGEKSESRPMKDWPW